MKYSFVVPIYKDGYLVDEFCAEFRQVFERYLGQTDITCTVELIFVDDGSEDESQQLLRAAIKKHPFVKVIFLSRNFGQHIAISCGYLHATGEFVGMLNADMQDPPDQIPILLDAIQSGECDIVFGLRANRLGSWGERLTSKSFNWLLNKMTGSNTPLNVSTLRVMNRRFLTAYNSLNEKSRYIPGLESWIGFKHGYRIVNHQQRKQGESSYNLGKRLSMAIDAIVSFSDLPLKIISSIGMLVAILGFALVLLVVLLKLFFIDFAPGFAAMISVIIFLAGLQILVVGFGGIYVGRVLREVQNRPTYIVKEKINFSGI